MEIESVSLINMNTVSSLPKYFTYNGVTFEKEESDVNKDGKGTNEVEIDTKLKHSKLGPTNNSNLSKTEGLAKLKSISQIKRESESDSILIKKEINSQDSNNSLQINSKDESESEHLLIKKEILQDDFSEDQKQEHSEECSDEESVFKPQTEIRINMKQAKIDRTEAFNEIEMIRHSELNNIYNKIIGRKDIAFKAALRKTKKFYFVLIKRFKKYRDFMVGDSKNITLIFAACNELCNNSHIFQKYINKYLESNYDIKEEFECKDRKRQISQGREHFTFTLPYFMMCFAFPTDIKKWVKDQQHNPEEKDLVSERLSIVPEIILLTLDKFSMKNLHKLLSYPELDFLIKYYLNKRNLDFSVSANAASEYLVKFKN